MEVFLTKKFKKEYDELPRYIQEKTEKQEKLFKSNPLHPSLHTEKLSPKWKDVWSFRIDQNYRIIFQFIGEDAVTGFLFWQKYSDNNRKLLYENCMNKYGICQPEPGESYKDCAIRYELNCRKASNATDEDIKKWLYKTN